MTHLPGVRVTPELILRELRTHDFGVLSSVDEEGQPRSAGVSYGLSAPSSDLAIYVMTRGQLQKTRNIARDARVARVVPVRRRLLGFLPPATIQLSGRAEILDENDATGNAVFRDSGWAGGSSRRTQTPGAAARRESAS